MKAEVFGSHAGVNKSFGSLRMAAALLLFFCNGLGAAGDSRVLLNADSFRAGSGGMPEGWSTAARLEAFPPEFSIADLPSLGGPGSLCIRGAAQAAANGCWQTELKGIDPQGWYEFEAWFTVRGVPWTQRQAMARLYWLDAQGGRAAMPEYVPESGGEGDWKRVHATYRPPEKAVSVRVELCLSHCPQGEIFWDRISLRRVSEPPARNVRLAAAEFRPSGTDTNLGMAEQYAPLVEEAGKQGCDILLLGETITLPGRGGLPALQKSETVPGPITRYLGELARKHKMYIIVGLLENERGALYNTAVLIDREGKVAGRYRKVHLPLEDLDIGVTPGDSYPVFETDFGRIGILVCYDIQFADPARALAVQGAEVLFCLNWGSDFPPAARALENQVYIVSSGFDTPTDIVDPRGKVIASQEKKKPGLAVAEIDLNRGVREAGFARRGQYLLRELRPDIPVPGYGR